MSDSAKQIMDIWTRERDHILETVAPDIIGLPAVMWESNMVLKGMRNEWWEEQTGTFPARARPAGSHPLFVISRSSLGCRVCPCSSKGRKGRYIRQGCRLEKTGRSMDRDSYVLEHLSFPVPRSLHLKKRPSLYGIVPQTCLAWRRG